MKRTPVADGEGPAPLVVVQAASDDAIALLMLNRPAKRNALSAPLLEQLAAALDELERRPSVRAVVLHGAGPAFCAGLDLVEAARSETAERSAQLVRQVLQAIAQSSLVTVAAVDGPALGGGGGLAAACDLVAASTGASFGFPEVRHGLAPALVSVVLARRLRGGDLRRLLLGGEPIDAAEARRIGLVDEVTEASGAVAAATELAATILRGAPAAVRRTKRLLGGAEGELQRAFDAALEAHREARHSDEAAAGMAAFGRRQDG